MSKIAISGAATGTATFTIESPATSTNRTLTLPDNTGTIITQNSTPAFASTIGLGGATAAASGAGITFPATQSASSNANTLDDYEEGTWNGTVSAQTGTITTSTFSEGRYTKVGRLVTVSGRLVINNAGTGSGSIRITLPFTPATDYWSGSGNENIAAGYTLAVFGTVNQLNIRKYDYATAIVNNHDFMFTATYAV